MARIDRPHAAEPISFSEPMIMSVQVPNAIDLDAYFQRIGSSPMRDRAPTLELLQAMHLGHAQTIAFENLTPLLKHPVSLDLDALQRKLIHQQRGGYCFEQNTLFRSVLEALGFPVTSLAARVLWNLPEGTVTPRSHMLLLVEVNGEPYIADVGFGGITLTTPLALIPNVEQETTHEPFRLLADGSDYIMQVKLEQGWKSLYRFDLQAHYPPDYEVSNWYVATHPNSLFVNSLLAARPAAECRYALLNNRLTIHYLDGRTDRRTLNTVAEMRTILEEAFRLQLPAIAELDQVLQRFVDAEAEA